MVGVVHLLHEIGDGELELMDPQRALLVLRRKAMPRTAIISRPALRNGGANGENFSRLLCISAIIRSSPSPRRATST
jgi:hypothetical protein